MSDLTVVLYTANALPSKFATNMRTKLMESIGELPLVCVSQKPMNLGYNTENIVVKPHRSHVNIYRQALIGALTAKTKYIALCEDDLLYSPEHFKYRPKQKPFAYNLGVWSIFTWQEPAMFTYKGGGRVNLCNLICDRVAFIEAMEERFKKHPDESKIDTRIWAEPSKYERQLGVTIQEREEFFTNPPNIMFSHETALSFQGLGKRKRLGEMRAFEIPYWGNAETIKALYD